MKKLIEWLFGYRIYYIHKDGFTRTVCPHGGAYRKADSFWGLPPKAVKVGSIGCSWCKYYNDEKSDQHSVWCKFRTGRNGK